MTWTASLLPDDALDPESLVGRMLNPEPEFTAEEVEMHAAPWSYLEPPEPLPLWRVLEQAHKQEAGCVFDHLGNTVLGEPDRYTRAAEIEALRDWLLPEEPAVISDSSPDDPIWARVNERQHLRALLTEQARIARGEP